LGRTPVRYPNDQENVQLPAIRNALVIGGGISAHCAAIALSRTGIDTSVVHTAVDPAPPLGIILRGNALRCLVALGLAQTCLAAGFPVERVICQDPQGNTIGQSCGVPMAGARLPAEIAVSYSALLRILEDCARTWGVRINSAGSIQRIEPGEGAAGVQFSDGRDAAYDLLIGADGVFSKTRSSVFGTRPAPRFTGQAIWSTAVARPPTFVDPIVVAGVNGGSAGFIPLDRHNGCLFLSQGERTVARQTLGVTPAELRERLASCGGQLALLREQIGAAQRVSYQPLYSIFMPAPWYSGRVVLIGDAAHCTLPHLAQGAALAMEDGVTLGELFTRPEPVHALLEEFMMRRFDRCRLLYEASVQLGEWELNPSPEADMQGLRARVAALLAQPG
jgi:2-polyprenyl-6-methoxyphenol hydroxylase-like FAD-dependent oxidoreductase